MLSIVPDQPSYAIIDKFGTVPRLFGCPYEALHDFICSPDRWPDDVAFWLNVCGGRRRQKDVRVVSEETPKRGTFYSARQLHYCLDLFPCHLQIKQVDFCFLGHLLDAMVRADFSVLHVDLDRSFPMRQFGVPLDKWMKAGFVRRAKDWGQQLDVLLHDDVMDMLNIELAPTPAGVEFA